ncbi:hypothetical protein D3C87_1519770 [compost metagenome]
MSGFTGASTGPELDGALAMAEPQEVAKGVRFFASRMGSCCVGAEAIIDGGSIA